MFHRFRDEVLTFSFCPLWKRCILPLYTLDQSIYIQVVEKILIWYSISFSLFLVLYCFAISPNSMRLSLVFPLCNLFFMASSLLPVSFIPKYINWSHFLFFKCRSSKDFSRIQGYWAFSKFSSRSHYILLIIIGKLSSILIPKYTNEI